MDGKIGAMRLLIEEIFIQPNGEGKLWVHVRFNDGSIWTPALIEQAIIAQKVAFCEKSKYPNLNHDAHLLPMEFLKRAIEGENICALASLEKFKLTHTRAYKKFCLKES